MTETRKILGQLALPATTLSAIYTVPAATQAVVSTIYICNLSSSPISVRVSVSQNGAADDPKQYLYYGLDVPGNETFAATVGLTLGAGDIIRGYASAINITMSVFGVEVA